mgnify:CR=1 FL=1
METEQRGEQSISLSMFRIAEMTASVVTNRGKGGQIKRGGKERTKKFVICYKNKVKNIVEFTEKCEVEL